ncbi:hypothetical protein, partial [Commensalibacter sp. Nvir]|uniref:hypothetical protein n=1 Tax=Commensalibacter sp. Nvir TaxID=3069817 RepID=UPI0030C8811B
MTSIIDIIKTIFITVPINLLAYYFYWQKIGTSISNRCRISSNLGETTKISEITLVNKKDKSEAIHEIYFVVDHTYYSYAKFDTPLILPAKGSCVIFPDEVTFYTRNNKKVDMFILFDLFLDPGLIIYI